MDNLKLAQLAERLLRAGVAPRHVRRSVEELRAHRADLLAQFTADGVSAAEAQRMVDARLGSVDAFYAATIARPELLSLPHRRPGVIFGLLPVLAVAALAVACVALTVGLVELTQLLQPAYKERAAIPPGVQATGDLLRLMALWGVPLLVAAFSALLAVRGRLRPWWPSIGVVLVALLGSATTLHVTWGAPGARGSIQAGLGFPGAYVRVLTVCAVVLLPYLFWAYRHRQPAALDQRADG